MKGANFKSFIASAILCIFFFSCTENKEKRIVIWTDKSEFAPYIEIFNQTHKTKAVLEYKENIAASLNHIQKEQSPDLLAGSWLLSGKNKKYLKNIDYLFDRKYIQSSQFYPALLNSGKMWNRQYLLPVSFNLPTVIFAEENSSFIEDYYMLSLEQIKEAGKKFNAKNKNERFIKIGFAPQSSDDFLYLAVKIKGSSFKEGKNSSLVWDNTALMQSILYIKDWIIQTNGSVQEESDFVYKYLSVTDDKRVTSNRTLFAATTSDKLFMLSSQQLDKIDFRWIQNDGYIPIEDSFTSMGITRKAKNKAGAAEFIEWFFKTETQKAFMERSNSMKLDTANFGIAGGFSSVKEVNEKILPLYYNAMLTNIPKSGSFSTPYKKPMYWNKIKTTLIIPYIKDAISAEPEKKVIPLTERYSDWKKQGFN